MSIKKQVRDSIYRKTNGRCGYCGEQLKDKWHIDHVIPQSSWDTSYYPKPATIKKDSIDNLLASCPPCNIQKRCLTIEQFRQDIKDRLERLSRYRADYRMVLRYGLIKETGIDIKFYFEKLNKEGDK